jgi:cytochrome c2
MPPALRILCILGRLPTFRVLIRWQPKHPSSLRKPEEMSNGERQFARKCSICHSVTDDGVRRAGPTLYKVFGRKAGALPGYSYSATLDGSDIIWSEETIDQLFLDGPDHYIPGSKMPMQVIALPEDRKDLVDYLKGGNRARRSGGRTTMKAMLTAFAALIVLTIGASQVSGSGRVLKRRAGQQLVCPSWRLRRAAPKGRFQTCDFRSKTACSPRAGVLSPFASFLIKLEKRVFSERRRGVGVILSGLRIEHQHGFSCVIAADAGKLRLVPVFRPKPAGKLKCPDDPVHQRDRHLSEPRF